MIFRISASMILLSGVAFAQTLPSLRVAVPTDPTGATPKSYVDTLVIGKLNAAGDTVTGSLSWLNPNGGTPDLRYAAGGLADAVIIAAGGDKVSYCPFIACVTMPTTDHSRTSALFMSTTQLDGMAQENTVGIETKSQTGIARVWQANTFYAIGDNVQSMGTNAVYRATAAGVSAASGTGPTGTSATISDGTVGWKWINSFFANAKVGLYNEMLAVDGSGDTWAQANNSVLQLGMRIGGAHINTELDFQNDAADCPVPSTNCHNLLLVTKGNYTSTSSINVSSSNPGPKAAGLFGIWLNGAYLAQEADLEVDGSAKVGLAFNSFLSGSHTTATILDKSTGVVGLLLQGNKTGSDISSVTTSPAAFANSGAHSIATIFDASASPAVLLITGSHANGSISDNSTSPQAILMGGTYSAAALTTANANTPIALQAKFGQRVCFNTNQNCVSYSGGKFFFTNDANVVKASLDNAGNMILSGTLTQNGIP